MEQERKGVFDWSRHPKTPGNIVYLANPNDLAVFGDDIEKDHFIHMLRQYNEKNEFKFKRSYIKYWCGIIAMALPWILLILRAILSTYDILTS